MRVIISYNPNKGQSLSIKMRFIPPLQKNLPAWILPQRGDCVCAMLVPASLTDIFRCPAGTAQRLRSSPSQTELYLQQHLFMIDSQFSVVLMRSAAIRVVHSDDQRTPAPAPSGRPDK